LSETSLIKDLKIKYKTIIVVYYNFNENHGVLIMKRNRINEG